MATDTRANPSALRKFNEATVAYIVPAFLVVLNVMDSYQTNEFNIAAGIYLLFSSLYNDEEPENPEPKKTASEKDKASKKSRRLLATFGACIVLLFGLEPVFSRVADLCFELFYSGEPFEQTFLNGYAGQDQEIRYQFRAVKSDRCIPDQSMIVGAIDHHIKTHGCKLRQTECLDLTKTFSGFLLIGPTRAFDMNLYCGPTLSFNTVCDLEERDSQVGI
ncbi:Ff.00g001090.m01.CDS01 [Fusarium sp. VM40]|nr:Ff.00g001090.m01.CDS01 [Fusarium sp. VM40]